MNDYQLSLFDNKKILVLGLGLEGQATLRFFGHNYPEISLAVADQKPLTGLESATRQLIQSSRIKTLHCGEKYLDSLNEYDLIIKSPGISPRLAQIAEAKKAGVRISSATNIFFQLCTGPIIGVSGTKGKSTTASLIHAILKKSGLKSCLIGNIGTAALDTLTTITPDHTSVFELSSYQLEDLQGELAIGVLLNLFPEHLDYHEQLDNYYQAKLNLAKCIKPNGSFVYNAEFEQLCDIARQIQCQPVPFNDQHSYIVDGTIFLDDKALMPTLEIPLLGRHNLVNVLAACKVAKQLNIDDDKIVEGITNFEPLPHRLQDLGEFHSIRFVDDALSTTPQSAIAALNAIPGQIGSIILGGFDRGYVFSKLAEVVISAKVGCVLLFPTSGSRIWEEFEQIRAKNPQSYLPQHFFVQDMKSCIELAYQHTPPNTWCLLSTASPSYGLFTDYKDKARQFSHWVREIAGRN